MNADDMQRLGWAKQRDELERHVADLNARIVDAERRITELDRLIGDEP